MDLTDDIKATLNAGSRKKSKKRIFIIILILILVAAGTYFFLLSKGPPSGGPDAGMSFKTAPAAVTDIHVTVSATGTLEPTNEVEVGSELSGTIQEVFVDYNDQVTEGQVLARLDITDLQAQVRKSKASLAAARASVRQAQATVDQTDRKLKNLKKVRELSGGKVPAQTDMDEAQANYTRAVADRASADASVAEVQASLDSTLTELSKADIISPVNGIVLTRDIEKGSTVAASFEAPVLFTLAEDLTKMKLNVDVDEADIGVVKEGLYAHFTVDAYPKRKFAAKIQQVRFNATTTDGVVTYETIMTCDNADLALRPGMTATADIIVKQADQVLSVPSAAMRFSMPKPGENNSKPSLLRMFMPGPSRRGNRSAKQVTITGGKDQETLWILDANKRPRPVPVKAGLSDGINTQILKGDITQGTQVIVSATTKGK
ncbi:efflux RND transporter periplasmic adaptor subunit [Desulfobacter hydrogenophilus]|uniref:Efflux RND transporter periplasmic adaptor subunit n=1 Tax=Desulfobacter hydrogenophilus TaxID=2291 RepID=A0A328FAY4_9BACT|nr:efflux RND transporter periplasmic adaptor subunit [Desulfobacter hydrogenophilus]NDY74131.1 efflux RND transporter periplasmic adaptor subunit [Desulfobacter hydrogenophilus]QBH15199.1 efflux RND transporter periplasmic adaptor subunit [Desulfobacter hydrogenophilus]RAM00253.1 efflux RND transporter periplasmic adaptor subunit [Desulfobacter hydrogenophilus]